MQFYVYRNVHYIGWNTPVQLKLEEYIDPTFTAEMYGLFLILCEGVEYTSIEALADAKTVALSEFFVSFETSPFRRWEAPYLTFADMVVWATYDIHQNLDTTICYLLPESVLWSPPPLLTNLIIEEEKDDDDVLLPIDYPNSENELEQEQQAQHEEVDSYFSVPVSHFFRNVALASILFPIQTATTHAFCCICYDNDRVVKKSTPLPTLTQHFIENPVRKLPVSYLLLNPCRQHHTCVRCLRTILLDFEGSHPVNEHHTHVPLYCECSNYEYHHYHFRILFSEEEWRQYQNFIAPFVNSHQKSVPCRQCHSICFVQKSDFRNLRTGLLKFYCQECDEDYCFDCGEVYRDNVCLTCLGLEMRDNPFGHCLHHFPKKQLGYHHMLPYKNHDMTLEMAVTYIFEQLLHNLDSLFYLQCKICRTPIYKTEDCNELHHCRTYQCYICGMMSSSPLAQGHWNSKFGCPRWNSNKELLAHIPKFKCSSACQTHKNGDCANTTHLEGIMQFSNYRRMKHVKHFMRCLLPGIRLQVHKVLTEAKQIPPYFYPTLQTIVQWNEESLNGPQLSSN
tara:strand:+ start:314 stop:2005 length:1692 start_codon:yes stop_codon:yes gene_type:complete